MAQKNKLKLTQIWLAVFTGVLIIIIIAARLFFGEPGFYWSFSLIQILLALIHLITMIRTRNYFYLAPFLFYLFVALTFFPPLSKFPGHLFFAIAAALSLIGFFIVLPSKRLNWRYREVLEYAALATEGTSNGFTSRSFPAGKSDQTRKDSVGMARFLLKNVVAYPFFEKDRIIFVIPRYMWLFLLLFKRNYAKSTYIAFYNTGEVTVRIDRQDYKSFREKLTFDQLCLALGDLFKQFMQFYKQGDTAKIMEKL